MIPVRSKTELLLLLVLHVRYKVALKVISSSLQGVGEEVEVMVLSVGGKVGVS